MIPHYTFKNVFYLPAKQFHSTHWLKQILYHCSSSVVAMWLYTLYMFCYSALVSHSLCFIQFVVYGLSLLLCSVFFPYPPPSWPGTCCGLFPLNSSSSFPQLPSAYTLGLFQSLEFTSNISASLQCKASGDNCCYELVLSTVNKTDL